MNNTHHKLPPTTISISWGCVRNDDSRSYSRTRAGLSGLVRLSRRLTELSSPDWIPGLTRLPENCNVLPPPAPCCRCRGASTYLLHIDLHGERRSCPTVTHVQKNLQYQRQEPCPGSGIGPASPHISLAEQGIETVIPDRQHRHELCGTCALVRLGLVGFGGVAQHYYVPAMRRMNGVEVCAVADPLLKSRGRAAGAFSSTRLHADYEGMFHAEQLDGVLVTSPPSTHLDVISCACAHGMAVLVEKPAALVWQLARLEMLAETTPRVMVNFNRRFWPPYRHIAARARSGEIGAIREIRYELHVDVLAWKAATRHRSSAAEGGLLHDLGTHAIDVVCRVAGYAPKSLQAAYGNREPLHERACIRLQYSGGTVAVCNLAYTRAACETLVVTGTAGSLLLENPNMTVRCLRGNVRDGWKERMFSLVALGYRGVRRSRSMLRYSIAQALAGFVTSVRDRTPFEPSLADAVANLRILAAAAKSADTGRTVEIDWGSGCLDAAIESR